MGLESEGWGQVKWGSKNVKVQTSAFTEFISTEKDH